MDDEDDDDDEDDEDDDSDDDDEEDNEEDDNDDQEDDNEDDEDDEMLRRMRMMTMMIERRWPGNGVPQSDNKQCEIHSIVSITFCPGDLCNEFCSSGISLYFTVLIIFRVIVLSLVLLPCRSYKSV